ncbi:N-acetylglucosamine-6-phosphate deacetylase isoform X3 [Cetorhinus maximus]
MGAERSGAAGNWLLPLKMPSNKSVSDAPVTQFQNCHILKDHKLQREDLWVREGKILNPEKLFFDEKGYADVQIDCKGSIIAPGFIDTQINGGYGTDFSLATDDLKCGVSMVARKLLSTGVTSFCPTLVTSPVSIYHQVIPQIEVQDGGPRGAGILGLHLEGPFISKDKKGAHPEEYLRTFENRGFRDLFDTYGSLDNVRIVTLAPELDRSEEVISELASRGIRVSLGHSVANLSQAEAAVKHGATFITHLFNAMLPFHHRDPGIVGLLTSNETPVGRSVFYGMIADGIHTNPAALRIAYRAHPKGCSVEAALEAATLHPAQLLGIEQAKGTLDYGTDADLVLLDRELNVKATYIAGEWVWKHSTIANEKEAE